MKNRLSAILVLLTCMFTCFTLGFLFGRMSAPGDTIVAQVPQPTRQVTVPPEPTELAVSSSSPAETTAPAEAETGLININTATLAQLDSLPGIGPVIAQRIIDYREHNGPFTALGQLTQVEGIGGKRLMAILDLITLE